MYCYTQLLTEEQENILNLIKETQINNSLQQQFQFLMTKLALSEEQLAYKLLHLCNNGFIVNSKFSATPSNKLGLEVGGDGCVSLFGEIIILTPSGLGYLKTNNILGQILSKSIAEASIPENSKTIMFNKIWQEIKDSGIDFMVKLTKAYITNP